MTVQPDTNTLAEEVKLAAAVLTTAPMPRGKWNTFMAALAALVARCEEADAWQHNIAEMNSQLAAKLDVALARAGEAERHRARAERAERALREFLHAIEQHVDPSSVSGRKLIPSLRLRGVMEEARAFLAASGPDAAVTE